MKKHRNFMSRLGLISACAIGISFFSTVPALASTTYDLYSSSDLVALENAINSRSAGSSTSPSLGDYNVILHNDINMNGITWSGIGTPQSWIGITGTFEGNGHTISNIQISNSSAVGPKGSLFNLTDNFTVENLKVTGSVTSTRFIGGIDGRTMGTLSMTNCISSVDLTLNNGSSNSVGGLVGQIGQGQTGNVTISDCAALGSFTSTTSTNPVGGLIGDVNSGGNITVTDSYAAATLSCSGGTVAGLVARNYNSALNLQNCWYLDNASTISPIGSDSASVSTSGCHRFTNGSLLASSLNGTTSGWKNATTKNYFNGYYYPELNFQ